MIEHAKKYILTDISVYIDEILSSVDNNKTAPGFYPICNHLLSSTFLMMIGAIEQKIYNIKWFIGFNDLEVRREIQKDFMRQSTGPESLNSAYSLFTQKIYEYNKNIKFPDSIWGDDIKLMESYKRTINIFSKSSIIHYTNSDYFDFRYNCPVRLFNSCENLHASLPRKHSRDTKRRAQTLLTHVENDIKLTIKNINSLATNDTDKISIGSTDERRESALRVFYKRLMYHRHSLAHNFKSSKPETPLLKDISNDIFRYDNYYYRFMICIYIDLVLQNIFSQFSSSKEKLLL